MASLFYGWQKCAKDTAPHISVRTGTLMGRSEPWKLSDVFVVEASWPETTEARKVFWECATEN